MGSVYTLIPRPVGSFAGLDVTSRYAFGLILDRWQLSRKQEGKHFRDEHGVYCLFSREAMAAEMGISLPTLRKAVRELVRRDLVYSRLSNTGDAWRYYMPERVLAELRAGKEQPKTDKGKSSSDGYNPRTGQTMLRHTPEDRRATYSAVILDFDDL